MCRKCALMIFNINCENNKKMFGKCDLSMIKLFLKMCKNVLKQDLIIGNVSLKGVEKV